MHRVELCHQRIYRWWRPFTICRGVENDWFPSRGKRFAEAWLEKTRKAQILICSSVATSNDLLGAGFDEKRSVLSL